LVCDIGGGTRLAIYVNGDVWHHHGFCPWADGTSPRILPWGLRVSPDQAESVKKQYGHALKKEVGDERVLYPARFR
jgi:cell division ATPase FtsA